MEGEEFRKAIYKLSTYLAIRDHSETELKQKLSRHYEPKLVQVALLHAKDEGWLQDENELAKRAYNSLNRRNKGHLYIETFLIKKGLPIVDIDFELEKEKAILFIESKYRYTKKGLNNKNKIIGQLRNRGFHDQTIMELVSEMSFGAMSFDETPDYDA